MISTPPPMLAVHCRGHAPQKVERLITVKQQVGYLCGPPRPTLITPKESRVPQITLKSLKLEAKST